MSTTFVSPAAFRPAPSSRAAVRRPTVRLTRRGRAVVVALALGLMLLVGLALSATSAATDEAGPAGATEAIRVGSGDTLWAIAAERATDGESVQGVIDEIRSLNGMDSGALDAGQLLLVPAAG